MSVKRRISYVAVAAALLAAGCSSSNSTATGGTDGSTPGGGSGGSSPGPTAPPLPPCPVDAIKSASAPVDVLVWYEPVSYTHLTLPTNREV